MTPWYLCNKLLHFCIFAKENIQVPHIIQVSARKTCHIGKFFLQIWLNLSDKISTPIWALLFLYDLLTDGKIESNELTIHTPYGTISRLCDIVLYLTDEVVIVGSDNKILIHIFERVSGWNRETVSELSLKMEKSEGIFTKKTFVLTPHMTYTVCAKIIFVLLVSCLREWRGDCISDREKQSNKMSSLLPIPFSFFFPIWAYTVSTYFLILSLWYHSSFFR